MNNYNEYIVRITDILGRWVWDKTYNNKIVEATQIIKDSNLVVAFGNGASCTLANHLVSDISKNSNTMALSLSLPSTLTAIANDDKFENVFKTQLEWITSLKFKQICVIAISSSGESANIVECLRSIHNRPEIKIIALSGFKSTNIVATLADISFFVNSNNYGIVEACHGIILHNIINQVLGVKYENPVGEAIYK